MHLLNGGTLLVDTFSQYVPGPVLTTLAGVALGPLLLGTANIFVQCGIFIFYALVLVYLYRAAIGVPRPAFCLMPSRKISSNLAFETGASS